VSSTEAVTLRADLECAGLMPKLSQWLPNRSAVLMRNGNTAVLPLRTVQWQYAASWRQTASWRFAAWVV
jgi:hypothetical protein